MKPNQRLALPLLLVLILTAKMAWGFKPNIHEDITRDALSEISTRVEGEFVAFSPQAIKEVMVANRSIDTVSIPFLRRIIPSPAFWVAANHFDNELFESSSGRLLRLRREAGDAARRNDGSTARKRLGEALHTLQDFYAHSNWVEIGATVGARRINDDLGERVIPNPGNFAFCPNDPNRLEDIGLLIPTTGYFSAFDVDISIRGGECQFTPEGKCAHGNESPSCPGINKDEPGGLKDAAHGVAADLARENTRRYVENLLRDLERSPDPARAIRALMGLPQPNRVGGTFAFVIDTTGSMADDLDFVRGSVERIVRNTVRSRREPDEYLLVPFNDPQVGPALANTDANRFLGDVRTLSAFGGGDCPEPLWEAMLVAIGQSEPWSALLYYTDASAKDTSLRGSAVAAANKLPTKITVMASGSCSPVDPTLVSFVEETGGLLFRLLPSELEQVPELVNTQMSRETVTISRARGTLTRGLRSFTIPIDSTVMEVSFTLSLLPATPRRGPVLPVTPRRAPVEPVPQSSGQDQNSETKSQAAALQTTRISLRDPWGIEVRPGDPGAMFSETSSATVITIQAPEPGEWELSVSGRGSFTMVAQAESLLSLLSFEFVELSPLVHSSFVPVPGQPLVGDEATGRASLLGSFETAKFQLMDESGETLQLIDLARGDPNAAADDFVGSFPLPNSPFRVAVSGLDKNAITYQRVFPTLFRAQSVELSIASATVNDRLPIGVTTVFQANIHNLGEPASFQLEASELNGFVSTVVPDVIALNADGIGTFEIEVTVPDDTVEGAQIILVATATRVDAPAVNNSAVIELVASNIGNALPIADAGPNQEQRLGSSVILDGSGSFDPDNRPTSLGFSWVQIAGPEVALVGSTTATPSFTAFDSGRYIFGLSVSDGEANVFDQVTIVVLNDDGSLPEQTPDLR